MNLYRIGGGIIGLFLLKEGISGLSTSASVLYLVVDLVIPGVGTFAKTSMEIIALLGMVLLVWALYPFWVRLRQSRQPQAIGRTAWAGWRGAARGGAQVEVVEERRASEWTLVIEHDRNV